MLKSTYKLEQQCNVLLATSPVTDYIRASWQPDTQ